MATATLPAPRDTADARRDAANLLRILADPTRLGVLALVRDRPRGVGELAGLVSMSQPAVSHHLAILKYARLVTATRDGKRTLYAPAEGLAERVGDVLGMVAPEKGRRR